MLFSTLISSALAANYDPDLTWRVLQTEHFNIHFHGGEEQLANEMGHLVEVVYDEMTTELKWEPKEKTAVVLVDNTDFANGYASYLPQNTIVIFVTAPEANSTLSFYHDWNDLIFTHEYTHILHIDTISGFNALLRKVLGRVVSINGLAPNWVVEGQATLMETRHTPAGRGRSNVPDMIKRTMTLADKFPPLGNMDGYQTANPGGNIRYLFGQDFMQHIADKHGEDVWTRWNHSYGRGLPYILPSKKVLGEWFPELYKDWKQSVEQRYAEQKAAIEEQPLTPFTLLTSQSEECFGATYAPDGRKMVFSCYNQHKGARILLADRDGKQQTIEQRGLFVKYFGWRNDSNAYAYAGSRVVNRFNLYNDIYLHQIGGSTKMLTAAKRARDPEFSPDGSNLLVVTNAAQNNQLAQLTIDQQLETHTDHTDHTQYSTPRYSPDGSWIVASIWQQGQRDLWLLNPDGSPKLRLTNDLNMELEPRWDKEGKRIFFSSDRSGVYNIYALDLLSEQLYQITNVLTGAFAPSANGDALLFTSYQHWGYAIAKMDLAEEKWLAKGPLALATPGELSALFESPTASLKPNREVILDSNPTLESRSQPETESDQTVQQPSGAQPASSNSTDTEDRSSTEEQPQTKNTAESSKEEPTQTSVEQTARTPKESWAPPPPPKLHWWEFKKRWRQWKKRDATPKPPAKMTSGTSQNPQQIDLATLPIPYEGLTGIGSAANPLMQLGLRFGLPHEPPNFGEAPTSGPTIEDEATFEAEERVEQDYDFDFPIERYNPAKTLFPPRFISPSIFQTIYGFMGMLSTASTDTLRQHLYSLSVSYRSDSQFFGWSAGYLLNRYIPIVSLGVFSSTTPYGSIYTYDGPPATGGTWVPNLTNTGQRYWDHRINGYAQISYAKNANQSYFLQWSGSHRQPWLPAGDGYSNAGLPANAYRPYLPNRGFFSSIGGGWRYVRGTSYARSISPEDTRLISVVARVQHPYIGSYILDDSDDAVGFQRLQATAEWREYSSLPWGNSHVLATKLALGASTGDTQRYGSFRLGGSFGESGYYTLPDELRALRGFDFAAASGDTYYLSSIEYRFPLWYADFGIGTLPVFARNLSAAVYIDGGNAFDDWENTPAPLLGSGFEVQARIIASWGAPISLRGGYAFGLNGGIPIGSIEGFYFWFGSSF